MLQGGVLPATCLNHRAPHIVKCRQLRFGFDEREEGSESGGTDGLKEASETIVVVDEILATWRAVCLKRFLKLQKHTVQTLKNNRRGFRRPQARETPRDL